MALRSIDFWVFFIAFTFILLGCTQSTPPASPSPLLPPPASGDRVLTVDELIDRKEEFQGQNVTVIGTARLMVSWCTEMVCSLPANCTPGDKFPCNSCGISATLERNDLAINLKAPVGGSLCNGIEMFVCEGEGYIDYGDCPLEDRKTYRITGLFYSSEFVSSLNVDHLEKID